MNMFNFFFIKSATSCTENWWKVVMLEAGAKLGVMVSPKEERMLL